MSDVDANAAAEWLRGEIQAELAYWQGRVKASTYYAFTDPEYHLGRNTAFEIEHAETAAARCEAELAILDFHDRAQTVAAAYDDGIGAGRPETAAGVLRLVAKDLASGYRHRPGYAEHWGEGG